MNKVNAQGPPSEGDCNQGGCAFMNSQFPTGPPFSAKPSFTPISSSMYAGDHAVCNVTSGETYLWSLCSADGGYVSYDAELTLFDGNTDTVLCYSNDYCGTAPKIQWTATFTGTVKIQINEFPCNTNFFSTHLRWKYHCEPLPLNPGPINGSDSICKNSTHTYFVDPVTGALNYNWTLPPGWTGTSTTNSINVQSNANGGIVSVKTINVCGSSLGQSTFAVVVSQPEVPIITFNGETLTSSIPTGNQWLLNGIVIPNATGNTYYPTQYGLYTVVATDYKGCSESSVPFNFNNLSASTRNAGNEIYVFPNPSRDKVSIKVKGLNINDQVTISNIIGMSVKVIYFEQFNPESTFTFDASELCPGIYFATIKSRNNTLTRKFIVHR